MTKLLLHISVYAALSCAGYGLTHLALSRPPSNVKVNQTVAAATNEKPTGKKSTPNNPKSPKKTSVASVKKTPTAESAATIEAALRALLLSESADESKVAEYAAALARHDPEKVILLILDSAFRSSRNVWRQLVSSGFKHQWDATVKAVIKHPRCQGSDKITGYDFLQPLAKKDPTLAYSALVAPGSRWGQDAHTYLALGWVETDPLGAVEFASSLQDGTERALLLGALIENWLAYDFKAAASWANRLTRAQMEELNIKWTSAKPMSLDEIGQLLRMLPPSIGIGEESQYLPRSIWDLLTPSTATEAWLVTLPPSEYRDALIFHYCAQNLAGDKERSDRLAQSLQGDAIKRAYTSYKAGFLAQTDINAALDYADTLLNDRSQAAARLTAIETYMETNPREAADFARSYRLRLSESELDWVMNRLGYKFPSTAAQLVQNEPANPTTAKWMRNSLSHWAAEDATSASAWVSKLPMGSHRDAAIQGMILSSFTKDWEGSLAWVQTISNNEVRSSMVETLASNVPDERRQHFQQWLADNSSSLPQDLLNKLAAVPGKPTSRRFGATYSEGNGIHWRYHK
jgi:hypothetical protein